MFRRVCLAWMLVLFCSQSFAAEGRRLALLIGVQQVREPRLRKLWFCDNDMQELAAALPKCGFLPENISLLSRRAAKEQNSDAFQPTAAAIRAGLAKLCNEAQPDDIVLFAFSGHGAQLNRDGRIYLCTPEAMLDDPASMLSMNELYQILGTQCKARIKLVFVDACRNDPTDLHPAIARRMAEPNPPEGMAVFFGCSRGQGSFETGMVYHGIFFHAVIQGLNGAASDIAGNITLPALEDYLSREVPMLMERYRTNPKYTQTPEFRGALNESVLLGSGNSPSQNGSLVTAIRAAGASLASPLYTQWAANYTKTHPNVTVEYKSGSVDGIAALKARTAHFAVRDMPLTDAERKSSPALLQIPTVTTPLVPIYHISGVKKLNLDGPTLADIYMGKIDNWKDRRIAALNSGTKLPDKHIVVVHRSDDCGANWIFSGYLSSVSTEWSTTAGSAATVKWPIGAPGAGSDGVAWIVANVDDSIGYVEPEWAEKKNLATAAISEGPSDVSYPIRGYTYIFFYQDLSYFKNRREADELINYLRWCESDGMAFAGTKYGGLTDVARREMETAIRSIVFDGRALLQPK